MCSHVGDDERSQGTWCAPGQFSHSGRRRSSLRQNEPWRAPMFVEHGLTVERHNALGVLLGNSRIVEVAGLLGDMKDIGILLCW